MQESGSIQEGLRWVATIAHLQKPKSNDRSSLKGLDHLALGTAAEL